MNGSRNEEYSLFYGCSTRPRNSPTQPERAGARLSATKAADRKRERSLVKGTSRVPGPGGCVGVMIGVFNIRLGSEERHMRADRTTALPPPQWKLVWMYRVIL